MTNAIEVKNLTKKYEGFTLDGLNLCLPSGCIMGLIGENGAGKSTSIKLILDMIKPDAGEIKVLGKDQTDASVKEDIGIVPDEIGLPEVLSAARIEKVMRNIYSRWDREVFYSYLKKFDLPSDKKFRDFSKGMKMKLGIAVAMSHSPKLLILDEATSGIDPVARDEILEMLNEFTRDESRSVLMSSHIVSDLEKICDYIAFIHKGKLMLCEEKDVLRDSHRVVRGSAAEIDAIPGEYVVGKKTSPYGAEAIVRSEAVPAGLDSGPVDIEQLFVFMVKKEELK